MKQEQEKPVGRKGFVVTDWVVLAAIAVGLSLVVMSYVGDIITRAGDGLSQTIENQAPGA